MRRFILDTNICLAYVRGHPSYQVVEGALNLQAEGTITLISVVTKGELLSLGIQNGWPTTKMKKLQSLLKKIYTIDINEKDQSLMQAYAEIDAYSQGNLHGKPLGLSARNMGKNDLWIAASAYISKAELVTTDGDFDHLNGSWITVHKF